MRYYSTCQRRGFKLLDLSVWEGHTHDSGRAPALGFFKLVNKTWTECDPPEYMDLGIGEPDIILPHGAKVVGRIASTENTTPVSAPVKLVPQHKEMGDIMNIESFTKGLQDLIEERNALRVEVEELRLRPDVIIKPEVELTVQYRLQYRWSGSAGDLVQEWELETQKAAEERMTFIKEYFKGAVFEDVDIIRYKIAID